MRSMVWLTSSRFRMSQTKAEASPPRLSMSARARSSSSASRAMSTTCAPSDASSRAMTRPSPRDPPVITIVIPAKSIALPARKARASSMPPPMAARIVPVRWLVVMIRCPLLTPDARRVQMPADRRDRFHVLELEAGGANVADDQGGRGLDGEPFNSDPAGCVPMKSHARLDQ